MKENISLFGFNWLIVGLVSIMLMVLSDILLRRGLKELFVVSAFLATSINCYIWTAAAITAQIDGLDFFNFAGILAFLSFFLGVIIIVNITSTRKPKVHKGHKIFVGIYYLLMSASLICMLFGV